LIDRIDGLRDLRRSNAGSTEAATGCYYQQIPGLTVSDKMQRCNTRGVATISRKKKT
jgi:hypothetical protein